MLTLLNTLLLTLLLLIVNNLNIWLKQLLYFEEIDKYIFSTIRKYN